MSIGPIFEFLTSNDRWLLVAGILFALVVLMTWIVSRAWQRARLAAEVSSIVHEMLRRGNSAEEIARVLLAADFPLTRNATDDRAADSPEVRAVKTLSDNSYESADIQRIVKTANESGGLDDRAAEIIITLAESWADTDAIIVVLESRRASQGKPATAGA